MQLNHKYTKEKSPRLKFKFKNSDKLQHNYSQVYQDIFALAATNGKLNGTFLEIGAFDPKLISNTYLLESEFNWNGISIDLKDLTSKFTKDRSNTTFIKSDALILDYTKVLEENNMPKQIDYLSLDIDPPIQTFNALKKLPLDTYRFSVITYETDYYDASHPLKQREMIRTESRKILESFGYIRVFSNVSNKTNNAPFEDWYLDSTQFDMDFIQQFIRKNESPLVVEKYMFT